MLIEDQLEEVIMGSIRSLLVEVTATGYRDGY